MPSPRVRALIGIAVLILTAGCAHVRPHVELPALDISDASFIATISAYAGTSALPGNRLEVLLNGDQIFPAKLEAIAAAKKTITFAQYVFEEGAPAADTARALAERCRAGVTVNVLLDGVGALSMPSEYRQIMEGAGCRVELYRPLTSFALDRLSFRNHRRILVIDGLVGFTGGSGTSGKWAGNGHMEGHWRDTDVRVEGPVVAQLQGAFAENWLEATGVALGGEDYFPYPMEPKGRIDAQIVRSSPAGGSTAIYTMFLLAIAAAQRTIHITNPYFVPDEKMVDTLIEAAQRGVRVVLILPGAIDHNLVRQASRSEFGRLMKAGIELYEYRAALLHAKTMVIDGVFSTVGSTNLDHRSLSLNDELNLVAYDRAFAQRLEQVFAQDLADSRKVTYGAWAQRGFVSRMLEFLALPLRDQM